MKSSIFEYNSQFKPIFQLISASEDGSVVLFDRRNRKVIKRLHFTKGTFPMCVKTFGGVVYVGDKVTESRNGLSNFAHKNVSLTNHS